MVALACTEAVGTGHMDGVDQMPVLRNDAQGCKLFWDDTQVLPDSVSAVVMRVLRWQRHPWAGKLPSPLTHPRACWPAPSCFLATIAIVEQRVKFMLSFIVGLLISGVNYEMFWRSPQDADEEEMFKRVEELTLERLKEAFPEAYNPAPKVKRVRTLCSRDALCR